MFGHELLIKVNFGGTFSGAPWLIPHLRHLRIPIPKTLGHTLYSAHLKPFGRKLLIKTHWAPRLILDNSSLYKHLIDRFCLQYYLNICMPNCYTILITRFRVSAHTLLIEKSRYHNIERDKRIYQICDMNDVEDEYHFILKCPFHTHL